MPFLQLVERRRSVRQYDGRTVEPEKIERCLQAARLAPSASNSQPWFYIVVRDDALRRQVAELTRFRPSAMNAFAAQAPILVVVAMERTKPHIVAATLLKRTDLNLIDVGISSEHFCLQATEEGLGTCMIGWFGERRIKRLLGIPTGMRVALVITLGYPAEGAKPKLRPRKPVSDLRSYDGFRSDPRRERTSDQ